MISNRPIPVFPESSWLTSLDPSRQENLLAHHASFWRRKSGSTPLIGCAPMSRLFPLQNLRIQHEGPFAASDITERVITADTQVRPAVLPGDDLFPAKMPLEPIPWSEGYTGANVYLSSRAQTVWTKPGEKVRENLDQLMAGLNALWRDKLAEATRKNVDASAGEYLISETLLRGPADCLEALIGAERVWLGLYAKGAVV